MFGVLRALVKSMLDRRRRSVERGYAADIHRVLDGEVLRMVDVGASGGVLPRWHPYRSDIAYVGFEPDSRSSQQLQGAEGAREFNSYKLLPCGAWDAEGKLSISFTSKPMCSSHFQPNFGFLSRFQDWKRFEVVGQGEVECQMLDGLLPEFGDGVDFIKLDLEGGELAVLHGAKDVLKTCLGLHVEVCFQPMRTGQPLFGDISAFLGQQGLEFVDFVTLMRWERDQYREIGQAVFGDALYMRTPESVIEMIEAGTMSASRAKRYLATLLIYDRGDLAAAFLDLATSARLLDDAGYIAAVRSLIARKRSAMDKQARFLARLSLLHSGWSNPNGSFHYIY